MAIYETNKRKQQPDSPFGIQGGPQTLPFIAKGRQSKNKASGFVTNAMTGIHDQRLEFSNISVLRKKLEIQATDKLRETT